MMKKLLMMLGALAMVAGLVYAPAMAQDEAEATEEKAVTIPDMLKEVEYVSKVKPKKKVSVYFFLRSHSKCGFCVVITGSNNAAYKEMKGKGAELIMLNCDPNTEAAKAWVEKADMKFPVITPETAGKVQVPAGGSGGTPNIVAVTSDGTVLESVSGKSKCEEILTRWKELVKEAKKAEREKRKEAESKKGKKKKSKKSKKSVDSDTAANDNGEAADLEL